MHKFLQQRAFNLQSTFEIGVDKMTANIFTQKTPQQAQIPMDLFFHDVVQTHWSLQLQAGLVMLTS